MVNSKKNTKSIIALVVLSLLLIASICLAATGAWFTDTANATGDAVNFGKLNIVEDSVSVARKNTETGNLMPEDTLTITVNYQLEGAADNGGAFVRYKVTATLKKSGETGEGTKLTLTGATADTDGYIYEAKITSDAAQSHELSVKFDGNTYGNEYKEATVTYEVEVQVIQAKNLDDDAKTAFAKYTADGVYAG